ncbi:hypothetical protein AB0O20_25515 [Streptomyces kronopolitis]|uniref:hypothetical protein n=1 Tax=Streptomyces kronopolitis TaxID=1612435 RepID=UPI0034320C90
MLIVGAGNSGCDIARDAAQRGPRGHQLAPRRRWRRGVRSRGLPGLPSASSICLASL